MIVRLCRKLIKFHENLNYDPNTNGERFVLEALRSEGLSCLFDVGANTGEWTSAAHEVFPTAAIHCFEIMPSTAEKLAQRVGGMDGVKINTCGLSEHGGTVALRFFPDNDTLTTATQYPHKLSACRTTGQVITGDAYIKEIAAEHVDFVKIDVEGMEHRVLAGLAGSLSKGTIDIVQFEYGTVNILTKFLLRDFYELFEGYGFAVGKIYPNHVDFREYAMKHEDFLGPNYLAVHRARSDFIRLLS